LLWRWKFAVALSANAIAGTRIAVRKKDFGGEDALMAHLLGRRAQASEAASFHTSGNGLALLLASPGFQRR
jgi:anti-sigma-K factor RskA